MILPDDPGQIGWAQPVRQRRVGMGIGAIVRGGRIIGEQVGHQAGTRGLFATTNRR